MKITLEISETEKLALENDLMSIEEWVQKAVEGKINNCKKRMFNEWGPKLRQDPDIEAIPANDEKLVKFICSHKDYKNRQQREAEAE